MPWIVRSRLTAVAACEVAVAGRCFLVQMSPWNGLVDLCLPSHEMLVLRFLAYLSQAEQKQEQSTA